MNLERLAKTRSYIDWMRKNKTLSLRGFLDDNDTEMPSIGTVGRSSSRLKPKIVCRVAQELSKIKLPLPLSRNVKKIPDLKSENPSFAALLIKYVNERFGGDAPKVYNAAKVSRKTYSAISSNELRPVSKETAIQFALALRLSRTEVDAFLKAAGFAFSPAILEDIVVCACIECGIYEIEDVNALLAEYGAKSFTAEGGCD